MIVGLLSIFGAYGLAIVMVHLMRFWLKPDRRQPIHYVLITRNNALHIEWYLRTLMFVSRLRGREVYIVIMDEGSDDETLSIVERLAVAQPYQLEIIEWNDPAQLNERMERFEDEEVVLVRLSNTKGMQNIPLFQ